MKKVIVTLMWITGLCLAGAEGSIWINVLGAQLFCLSSYMLIEICEDLHRDIQ